MKTIGAGAREAAEGSAHDAGEAAPAARIRARLAEHVRVVEELARQAEVMARIADVIVTALKSGRKVLAFGNGGSASDAQHLAGELIGRYLMERAALPAIALTANTATLTAIANDYGYADVFARQIEALGQPGDVAVGLTTSGRSDNVLRALKAARSAGLRTVALTGRAGLALGEADVELRVPSDATPRIQEAHIVAIHCVCELVEQGWAR